MLIKITFDGNKKVNANINGHVVKTDQPVHLGGEGTAPSPFEVFLASLGTCAGIYVKSFCDQRDIPTADMYLTQEVEYNKDRKLLEKVSIYIHVPSQFPEKYDDAMIHTASLCLVKRHLKEDIKLDVSVKRDS